MTPDDAQEYTESLGQIVAGSWRQIALAKRLGVPKALGLSTREWVDDRLGGYVKLGVPDRRDAVAELLDEGHSQREAAEILGVTEATVNRDAHSGVTNVTTEGPDQADATPPSVTNVTTEPPLDAVAMLAADAELRREAAKPRHQDQPDDDWFTPPWLFDQLGLTFDVDVCAPVNPGHRTTPALNYYTIEDDGLAQEWKGLIWCNPPYSDSGGWARRWCDHGNGLLLTHIPANAAWAVDVWQRADAAIWLQAVEFVRPSGVIQRPGYALQLAALGDASVAALSLVRAPKSGAVWRRVVVA